MFTVFHQGKKFTGKLFYQQKRTELLKINDNNIMSIVPEEQMYWNKFSNEMIQRLMELERDALAQWWAKLFVEINKRKHLNSNHDRDLFLRDMTQFSPLKTPAINVDQVSHYCM